MHSPLRAGRVLAALVMAGALAAAPGCDEGETEQRGELRLSMAGDSVKNERLMAPAFESARRTVNREVELPADLEVRVVDDREAQGRGISGPTYEPHDRAVLFPWSFVDDSRRRLGDDEELREAMVFALFHELTHGLVDQLDVPVVGGEERAADSLAAILAIRSEPGGAAIPLGMASLEQAKARSAGTPSFADYADDHELDSERAVDTRCLVYGSDPRRYAGLVGKDLPATRAAGCEFEYAQELRAWRRLLAPWLTDRGGLRPEK